RRPACGTHRTFGPSLTPCTSRCTLRIRDERSSALRHTWAAAGGRLPSRPRQSTSQKTIRRKLASSCDALQIDDCSCRLMSRPTDSSSTLFHDIGIAIDDFEVIPVWVAEKEPLKGRLANRWNKGCPVGDQPLFQRGKFTARIEKRKVPAKLRLERRRLKAFNFQNM